MENTGQVMTPSFPATGEVVDLLKDTVVSIVAAMTADYGDNFKRTFSSDEEIRQLKRRLYQKLRGFEIDVIRDGYEACIADSPKFCPTVPDIVAHVQGSAKDKQRRLHNCEVDALAALPAPPVTADPERVLSMSRAALSVPKGDEVTRAERLKGLLQCHESLLAVDKARGLIATGPDWSNLGCSVEMCRQPGVIAHGPKGNFYCGEHFKA